MKHQHYGTQQVIRGCVRAGMMVVYKDQIWKASANRKGSLYLSNLRENTRTKDIWITILLDGRGQALIN
ncbi:cell division inhibitor protein [Lelliottia nimipressuralis]